MFGRMKQKVLEKAGRAKSTQLPEDVAGIVEWFKQMPSRVKQMQTGFVDLDGHLKAKNRAEFIDSLNFLGAASSEINTKACIEMHKSKVNQEAELIGKISMECEKLKSYQNSECKAHSSAISNLNKWRLNMDAASNAFESNETDGNKLKMENATREYEEALAKIRDLYKAIPGEEEAHLKVTMNLCGHLQNHFK